MSKEFMKQAAAIAALDYIPDDGIVGVGTGSTTNFFIDALGEIKHRIQGAVSSSEASTARLKKLQVPVYDLNSVDSVPVYVDGADQANKLLQLVKGGGGALTREKILATVAEQFICIIDESKMLGSFGNFPIPVEVIPMARSYVAREIVKLGGDPILRENFVTDNGNLIIDIHQLTVTHPIQLEQTINQITGVVCNGLFAVRPADKLIIGTGEGVKIIK